MCNKAIFKLNNGNGALLCSRCSIIVKTGSDFTEEEWAAATEGKKIPAQYCNDCKQKK